MLEVAIVDRIEMHLTRVLAAPSRLPANYHNMPRRTVERHTKFVVVRKPKLPQYLEKVVTYKKYPYYDEYRPWEDNFKRINQYGVKTRKIYVEPIREWQFFRGDRVEVIRGPDKGKQGIINYIVKERNWVFVQGLNVRRELINRHGSLLGNVITKEEPYLINIEVKLVDPSDLLPTDIEWRYDDEGNRLRVSKRTERIIPLPSQAYETIDYVEKDAYADQPKDTPSKLATQVTFNPVAKTFEMDICDQMKINEDRVPYPMYWY